jgi:hypothetical protein
MRCSHSITWKEKIHYHLQESLQFVHILCHINLAHSFKYRPIKLSLPFRFSYQNPEHNFILLLKD